MAFESAQNKSQGNSQAASRAESKPRPFVKRAPRRVFKRPIGVLRAGVYSMVNALQLSEDGLLFEVHEREMKLKVDDQIVISAVIPAGSGIVSRAQIVYGRATAVAGVFQYGVRFESLAKVKRRLIRTYVTAKTQAEAEAEILETEAESKVREAKAGDFKIVTPIKGRA